MAKSFPIYFSFTISPSEPFTWAALHIICDAISCFNKTRWLSREHGYQNACEIVKSSQRKPQFNSMKQKRGKGKSDPTAPCITETKHFTQRHDADSGRCFRECTRHRAHRAHISIQAFYVFINRRRIDKRMHTMIAQSVETSKQLNVANRRNHMWNAKIRNKHAKSVWQRASERASPTKMPTSRWNNIFWWFKNDFEFFRAIFRFRFSNTIPIRLLCAPQRLDGDSVANDGSHSHVACSFFVFLWHHAPTYSVKSSSTPPFDWIILLRRCSFIQMKTQKWIFDARTKNR